MQMRLMTSDDCPHVASVLNRAIEHGIAHFGTTATDADEVRGDWEATRAYMPWLVAHDDDGRFLGFAKASKWKVRQAYDWTVEAGIYISDDAQGKGVGRSLYDLLFALLTAQGYKVVLAGVTVPNPASERLHEACGFTRVGDIDPAGYKLGQWASVRLYQKHLGAFDAPGQIRRVAEVWDQAQERSQA